VRSRRAFFEIVRDSIIARARAVQSLRALRTRSLIRVKPPPAETPPRVESGPFSAPRSCRLGLPGTTPTACRACRGAACCKPKQQARASSNAKSNAVNELP